MLSVHKCTWCKCRGWTDEYPGCKRQLPPAVSMSQILTPVTREFWRWPLPILSWPLEQASASRAQSSASPLAACAAGPLAPCPLGLWRCVPEAAPLQKAVPCFHSGRANCSSSPAQCAQPGSKPLNIPQDKWVIFFLSFCRKCKVQSPAGWHVLILDKIVSSPCL